MHKQNRHHAASNFLQMHGGRDAGKKAGNQGLASTKKLASLRCKRGGLAAGEGCGGSKRRRTVRVA